MKNKRFVVIDKLFNANSNREINHAGYLIAKDSSLARSGILQYSAGSIGHPT